jgi:hypothetical protein
VAWRVCGSFSHLTLRVGVSRFYRELNHLGETRPACWSVVFLQNRSLIPRN